jgi:hypothetical protein
MFTITPSDVALAPILPVVAKSALVVGVLTGLVAVLSPRAFGKLAALGGMWFDTSAAFEQMDRPMYILSPLRKTRLFGTIVLSGAAAIVLVTPAAAPWAWIAWLVGGGLALVGVVAIACPACFRSIAGAADIWIDTSRCFSALDRYVDIDGAVVRHCRIFGSLVLAASAAIAAVFFV